MKYLLLLNLVLVLSACSKSSNDNPAEEPKGLAGLEKACVKAGGQIDAVTLTCNCADPKTKYIGGEVSQCIDRSKISNTIGMKQDDDQRGTIAFGRNVAFIDWLDKDIWRETLSPIDPATIDLPLVAPEGKIHRWVTYKDSSELLNLKVRPKEYYMSAKTIDPEHSNIQSRDPNLIRSYETFTVYQTLDHFLCRADLSTRSEAENCSFITTLTPGRRSEAAIYLMYVWMNNRFYQSRKTPFLEARPNTKVLDLDEAQNCNRRCVIERQYEIFMVRGEITENTLIESGQVIGHIIRTVDTRTQTMAIAYLDHAYGLSHIIEYTPKNIFIFDGSGELARTLVPGDIDED